MPQVVVVTEQSAAAYDGPVTTTIKKDDNGDVDRESDTTAPNKAAANRGKPLRRKRRTRVPDKPNYPLNLWSIMKNCIGKDLSKIPMPVNFSEPLSMLQRLTEDYEYAEILDIAAK